MSEFYFSPCVCIRPRSGAFENKLCLLCVISQLWHFSSCAAVVVAIVIVVVAIVIVVVAFVIVVVIVPFVITGPAGGHGVAAGDATKRCHVACRWDVQCSSTAVQ